MLALHRWHDVRVEVERDGHRAVAKPLGYDLGRDSHLERKGCVGVPQIVVMPTSA